MASSPIVISSDSSDEEFPQAIATTRCKKRKICVYSDSSDSADSTAFVKSEPFW